MGQMGTRYYPGIGNTILHHMAIERWKVTVLKHIAPVVTITLLTGGTLALVGNRGPVLDSHTSILFNVGDRAKPIHAGDPVEIQWIVRELRHGCGGIIYQVWIDSEGAVYGAQDPSTPVPVRYNVTDKPQTFYRTRIVPSEMKPGDATFAPVAERWCPAGNFLQKHVWPIKEKLPEVKFTVAPRP